MTFMYVFQIISILLVLLHVTSPLRTIPSLLLQKHAHKQKQVKSYISASRVLDNDFTVKSRISYISPLRALSEETPEAESDGISKYKYIILAVLATIGFGLTNSGIDFQAIIEQNIEYIGDLGPYGYVYFGMIYIIAEILAIPVFPLTASSGYLFGLVPGTITVLSCATVAACISFSIGRTFLRDWALKMTSGNKQWKAIDQAVSKEGFKVILLLRLSPLLPFSLSNYLYGLTSVDFWSFLAGTFLGFAPGTFGIVYAGSVGKDLLSMDGNGLPWYGYAAIGVVILLFAQTIAKIATDALQNMDDGLFEATTQVQKDP